MTRIRPLLAPVLLAALATFSPLAHAECQMAKLGTLPVEFTGLFLKIPGKINGHDISIVVDTAAQESIIRPETATAAGVRLTSNSRLDAGDAPVYRATIDELHVGDFPVRNKVWTALGGDGWTGDTGMVLGIDFWSKVDFEINIAQSEIILWTTNDCKKASLAYWTQDFMLAKLRKGQAGAIGTDVVLNGKDVQATIDTGSMITVVDSKLGRRMKVRTADEQPMVAGAAGSDAYLAIFDSFQFGDLTVKNAKILAMDMGRFSRVSASPLIEVGPMIIGLDFLRANRVLVANSQNLIYITYNGGPIFQTRLSDPAGN